MVSALKDSLSITVMQLCKRRAEAKLIFCFHGICCILLREVVSVTGKKKELIRYGKVNLH